MNARKSDLKTSLSKATDLGIIDSWLRGVAALVPEAAKDFDRHTLTVGAFDSITHSDIRRTTGFKDLLEACTRNDMRIDMTDGGKGLFETQLHAEQPFLKSSIFGRLEVTRMQRVEHYSNS